MSTLCGKITVLRPGSVQGHGKQWKEERAAATLHSTSQGHGDAGQRFQSGAHGSLHGSHRRPRPQSAKLPGAKGNPAVGIECRIQGASSGRNGPRNRGRSASRQANGQAATGESRPATDSLYLQRNEAATEPGRSSIKVRDPASGGVGRLKLTDF